MILAGRLLINIPLTHTTSVRSEPTLLDFAVKGLSRLSFILRLTDRPGMERPKMMMLLLLPACAHFGGVADSRLLAKVQPKL